MEDRNNQNTPVDELSRKQVFTDLDTKPAQPLLIESPDDLPEPLFDKRAVLDEAYAEQKTQRENAAPDRPRTPSVRRDFSETPPALSRRPKANKPRRVRPVKFTDTRLISGEMISDALRRIAREFCALLAFCAVVGAVFGIKGFVVDQMTDDDYSSLARSTSYSAPVSIGTLEWTDPTLADGFAAAQAVCTQLGTPITDSTVLKKSGHELLYPDDVTAGMQTALTAEQVKLKTNMSNLDLLTQIYMNLEAGKPVIVPLSEPNGDTIYYAIVTHMDAENDEITAQTLYNGSKTYTFEQFIAASRFENTDDLPLQVRAGLTFGAWSRNTAIFVE